MRHSPTLRPTIGRHELSREPHRYRINDHHTFSLDDSFASQPPGRTLERRILAIIASYAVVIGLFALIVPLTVQELVNTFAFAIQPIMIVTLVAIMLGRCC